MITLQIGGQILEGWSQVSVSRKLDALAGSFSFGFGEISPTDPTARAIKRGDLASIMLDGVPILAGAIGELSTSYDGSSGSVTAAGRDLTGDLVDSSAIAEPGEWNGATVGLIARHLLAPFPLLRWRSDLSDPAAGVVKSFALNTGETVFAALDTLARMRGLLVNSDGAGGVFMRRPGVIRAPVTIARGSSIISASLRDSDSGRFSRYICHGQGAGLADWNAGGTPGQSVRAEALDPGVGRPRSLVIMSETGATLPELLARVNFEASSRAAKSRRVSYTLPGWTLDGHLWTPGEIVPVYDPALAIGTSTGLPVEMVLASVRFSASATEGKRAALELVPRGAFSVLPILPATTKGLELWEV